MDFDKAQAEWILGRYPRAHLPELAAQAMMAGFEGPCILDLVGYAPPSLHRLTDRVVEGAFREMNRPSIDVVQAALRLARYEALKLLRRQTSAVVAVENICALVSCVYRERLPPALEEFRYLLDEDSYWSHHPEALDQVVVELAWSLLEGEGPV